MIRLASILVVSALLYGCSSLGVANVGVDQCISVNDVAKNPAAYEGRRALYCGYFRNDYPIMSIYGNRHDAENGSLLTQISAKYNSCIVGSGAKQLRGRDGSSVRIRGVFSETDTASYGMSVGSLSDVGEVVLDGLTLDCKDYEIRLMTPAR